MDWTAYVPKVTAAAPGYVKATVFNTGISNRPGQREYRPEILLKPSGFDSKTTFIFEDGSGPVTDDARLDALRIQVRRDTGRGSAHTCLDLSRTGVEAIRTRDLYCKGHLGQQVL